MAAARIGPRRPEYPLLTRRSAGMALWRVSEDMNGLSFSVGAGRRSRFSPIYAADGVTVIGSWYGATSRPGAIFESVFHDIRPSHRYPRVQPNEYVDRYLSPITTTRDLTLVDLTSTGLHAIGITRVALIESTSRRYAWTNDIATRLRAAAPAADGFVWVSRAHDRAESVVLFDDSVPARMIDTHPTERSLALGLGPGLNLLRELALDAKITLVLPNP